ncbi:DUF2207 domain-containing protein [Roseibium sp.]|uniref:DUF2207 domain-containing protein n=1 Tax=Roseibium sp. TaxID=1936156 RepID=UPI003A984E83
MRMTLIARRVICLLAVLLGCALLSTRADANEAITNFHAAIDVAEDGTLTVTEEITVQAEGDQIRRGIYRDLPLIFEMASGRKARAGFELVSVERDGASEPYRVERSGDGVRIYIGDSDVFLEPGLYRYTITYLTTRQIRFFDSHDEVYWNVTGNLWGFPINKASAQVTLPAGVTASRWDAYTGAFGETGKDFVTESRSGSHQVYFETTRPLAPRQGLTIVVAMPKGAVVPPTEADEIGWLLSDYRAEIAGAFGLLLVLGYYIYAWVRVGRDPPAGVIYPRFEAPEGISPALASYIEDRGFAGQGWTALSAACISLAVKGKLVLEQLSDGLRLELVQGGGTAGPWGGKPVSADELPSGEAAVLRFLDRQGGAFSVNKDNGPSVVLLGNSFRSAIEKESRQRYFKSNLVFSAIGVLFSLLAVVGIINFGDVSGDEIAITLPLMIIGTVASCMLITVVNSLSGSRSLLQRVGSIMGLFFVLIVLLVLGGASAVAAFSEGSLLTLVAVLIVATNVFFIALMGAPTALGRSVLDAIEGLKLYLEVAEAERMNMEGVPRMSPDHFEHLLPYAVALGVEKPWAETFASWLRTATPAEGTSYQPRWSRGAGFDAHNIAGAVSGTTGALASSFSSSVPAPKSSSSGFSGGSSGGGGGGGGGGGW